MTDHRAVDPYAVLGIPRGATPLQAARARRRLAKQFHPDINPGGETSERMRRINDAWHVLSSATLRAEYDRLHPTAGTERSGHWAASRPEIRPSPPASSGSWASWRASAEATRAAPPTRRQPGEVPIPPTRRPEPIMAAPRTFRDSGWAALLAAVAFLAILAAAVVVGRLV
jgi:curved DNA-binding protein CbpA